MNNKIFAKNRKKFITLKEYRDVKINNNKVESVDERFIQCKECGKEYAENIWKNDYYVCPSCNYHMPVSAGYRIRTLVDKGTFKEIGKNISTTNPIKFPGYSEKLKKAEENSKLKDAIITGVGNIEGEKAVIAVLERKFMMGSMGTVVGDKVTQAIEYAKKQKLPLIIFSASGGARMQEGMFSLMQMAKTSAAIQSFSENGGLYISCLTNPTMGGVSASFANLGDIIMAEPDALIGFAGPRVIEQTIGEKLPKGFQKSEFQEEHGFVDMIVERKNIKSVINRILKMHSKKRKR